MGMATIESIEVVSRSNAIKPDSFSAKANNSLSRSKEVIAS